MEGVMRPTAILLGSALLLLTCGQDPTKAQKPAPKPAEAALHEELDQTPLLVEDASLGMGGAPMCCCMGDEDVVPSEIGVGDPLGCDWFDPELDLPEDAGVPMEDPGCP